MVNWVILARMETKKALMDYPNLSLELTMAELLAYWPQTIPVLLRYHLHCIGCRMAAFDTLGEVIRNYDLGGQSFEADLRSAIHFAS